VRVERIQAAVDFVDDLGCRHTRFYFTDPTTPLVLSDVLVGQISRDPAADPDPQPAGELVPRALGEQRRYRFGWRGALVAQRILTHEPVDGSLQQLTIVIGGQDYLLGPVSFTAEGIGDRVVVENLVGSGMGFDVSGSAEVRFGAELELRANFGWSTTFNELTYAGSGSASGTWPQLAFHQDVTSPVALTADGTSSTYTPGDRY